jgi:hypothetical protein
MKCLLCSASIIDRRSREAIGWDWFTGYFDDTAVFCPIHKTSVMRHALFEQCHRKPSGPDKRWSLDCAVNIMRANNR